MSCGLVKPGATTLASAGAKSVEQQDCKASGQQDEIGDDAEGAPCAVVIAAVDMIEEDRNEDDRERPGGQQVIQEIGQGEAGEINVSRAAGAEGAPNDLFAHQANDPAEEDRGSPDRGRDTHCAGLASLRLRPRLHLF